MLAFCFFCVFDAMCIGFLMVLAGRPPLIAICVVFCVFDAMCMGFLIGFADRAPLAAICVVFLVFLCF